ncbi:MAG: SpoIIE family protein phosphatase [Brevinema sp.]
MTTMVAFLFHGLTILFLTMVSILLTIYFANSFRFFRLVDNIFYSYTSLVALKTDWKNSFLEKMAEESRKLFHSAFFCVMMVNKNQAKFCVVAAAKKYSFLTDQINKKEFPINTNRRFHFLPTFPSERGIFMEERVRRDMGLKCSFTVPIITENNKPEALINLYFENYFSAILASFTYIIFRNRINYFFAAMLRNVYTDQKDLAEVLLEQIDGYALVSLDNKAQIISWNKGAEKLFGYRGVEIIGQKFSVLFHESETSSLDRCLEILEIKDEIKFFASLKDRMTVTLKAELAMKRMVQESGNIIGYSVFIKDITKEDIFKQNIQQYSFINYTILENSQDGILILDESDKIIFYNQRVRTILDNPMNLFGVPGRKIFPRHFSEQFEDALHSLKDSKSEFETLDYMFEQHYYNIRFFRVHKNADNDYGGVIVFFIDETLRMNTLIELEEKKEALEVINRNLLDALSSARVMQQNLIPKTLPARDDFSCAVLYQLSDEIGGDFYYIDMLKADGKEYAIAFVSDVSGHGIAASMMNVMVKDVYISLREEMEHGHIPVVPSAFLEQLNKRLFDLDFFENKFITCFTAVINFTDKEVTMASAGHPLPYFVHEDKATIFNFKRAVPLGVLETLPKSLEYKMSYTSGDKFVFYTDGFLDIFEKAGKTPSESIEEFLTENAGASLDELVDLSEKQNTLYREENKLSPDDLTILYIKL